MRTEFQKMLLTVGLAGITVYTLMTCITEQCEYFRFAGSAKTWRNIGVYASYVGYGRCKIVEPVVRADTVIYQPRGSVSCKELQQPSLFR